MFLFIYIVIQSNFMHTKTTKMKYFVLNMIIYMHENFTIDFFNLFLPKKIVNFFFYFRKCYIESHKLIYYKIFFNKKFYMRLIIKIILKNYSKKLLIFNFSLTFKRSKKTRKFHYIVFSLFL